MLIVIIVTKTSINEPVALMTVLHKNTDFSTMRDFLLK